MELVVSVNSLCCCYCKYSRGTVSGHPYYSGSHLTHSSQAALDGWCMLRFSRSLDAEGYGTRYASLQTVFRWNKIISPLGQETTIIFDQPFFRAWTKLCSASYTVQSCFSSSFAKRFRRIQLWPPRGLLSPGSFIFR